MRAPTDIQIFSDAAWKSILFSNVLVFFALAVWLAIAGVPIDGLPWLLLSYILLFSAPSFLGVRLFLLRWARHRVKSHNRLEWRWAIGLGLAAGAISGLIWSLVVLFIIGLIDPVFDSEVVLIAIGIGMAIATPSGLLAGAALKWFSRAYQPDPSQFF